jgi:hypothetical protein
MRALRIFRGGWAPGPSRRAPCTVIHVEEAGRPAEHQSRINIPNRKTIPNPFPLFGGPEQSGNMWNAEFCEVTHQNQRIAELPSAFLVSSHPSSNPTGSNVIEPTPKIVIMM